MNLKRESDKERKNPTWDLPTLDPSSIELQLNIKPILKGKKEIHLPQKKLK
jgi:hypothetical protein